MFVIHRAVRICCLSLWYMISIQWASAKTQILYLLLSLIFVLFISSKTETLYFRDWFDNSEIPDLEGSLFVYYSEEFIFIGADECDVVLKKQAAPFFLP